jgi:Uma2 family endonuclease
MIYCIGMSVVPHQSPLPPRAVFTSEPIFRLTVEQYHAMIRSGQLTEDDPVELLEGILVFKMPKNTPHTSATTLARREVERLLPGGWYYRSQEPVTLGDGEPEPDGAAVRGGIEDHFHPHPGPAAVGLVIEVADTSLARDRGLKLRSYARAGIPAYWISNLVERQVEAYSDPDSSPSSEPTYRGFEVFRAGEAVPLRLPGHEALGVVPVDALLPPPAHPASDE